jgi:D-glycero-D-manno-heptose 1,7-bisphosphate phosphatase
VQHLKSGINNKAKTLTNPAVFIDRDGVINKDHGYISKVDDFEYIEGVFEACRAFKKMGYLLVLVTNQSGIARGYFTEDEFLTLTEWMDWNFADEGVELDGIYYCPHHPEQGNDIYRQDCACRKPKAGMFLAAADFLKIDLSRSVMIGDKGSDMQAAITAGINQRILVKTGKAVTSESEVLASTVLDSIADVPAYLASHS